MDRVYIVIKRWWDEEKVLSVYNNKEAAEEHRNLERYKLSKEDPDYENDGYCVYIIRKDVRGKRYEM